MGRSRQTMQSPVLEPAPEPKKRRFPRKIVITILVALVGMGCNCPLLSAVIPTETPRSPSVPTIQAEAPNNPTIPTIKAGVPTMMVATKAGSSADVVGAWHGDSCDEPEGTFLYKWSLDLMKNPVTGQVMGTLKFHDCPGGGRALFRVVGVEQAGTVITLTGTLKNGGGELLQTAQGKVTTSSSETGAMSFTFDSSTGKIEPNFTQ